MAMVNDESELEYLDEASELTDYQLDHVLDLPHLFDNSPDGIDEMIDVNQLISAEEPIKIDLDVAYLAGTDETRSAKVDLYNSGTTRHMTGFYHCLLNYIDVDPIPIKTDDKRTFQAMGKGDMYIYLPN